MLSFLAGSLIFIVAVSNGEMDKPQLDKALAKSYIGKHLLVGITYLDYNDNFIEQKQVHAIKPDSIYFGASGQIEHRVKIYARLGARAAFADQARPHGIVKFGKVAVTVLHAHKVTLLVRTRNLAKDPESAQ